MSFFRRRGRVAGERLPAPSLSSAWSRDMPPRPGRTGQPQRDDWPRLNPHGFPVDRGYMTGGIDNPDCDPCGAGPLKTGENS